MIKKIQQDFSYYSHEFKDNYRKGVHRLRTILASRAQAQAFVSNAGGVAVGARLRAGNAGQETHRSCMRCLRLRRISTMRCRRFLGSIYEGRRRKSGRDVLGQRSLSGNPARSGFVSCRWCRHGKRREMDRNSGRTELQICTGI